MDDENDDEEVDVVDEQEDELISLVFLVGLADNNDLRAIMSPFWQAM